MPMQILAHFRTRALTFTRLSHSRPHYAFHSACPSVRPSVRPSACPSRLVSEDSHWRRQLWGNETRPFCSLRLYTNLAVSIYVHLQWAVADSKWTPHTSPFQPQIHGCLSINLCDFCLTSWTHTPSPPAAHNPGDVTAQERNVVGSRFSRQAYNVFWGQEVVG